MHGSVAAGDCYYSSYLSFVHSRLMEKKYHIHRGPARVAFYLSTEDLKFTLKNICRENIRKHLLDLDPHSHLFTGCRNLDFQSYLLILYYTTCLFSKDISTRVCLFTGVVCVAPAMHARPPAMHAPRHATPIHSHPPFPSHTCPQPRMPLSLCTISCPNED